MTVTLQIPPASLRALRVEIGPLIHRPLDRAVEARWRAMCAENPRLFDGPILALESIDMEGATIHCRRDHYRFLAVQPAVPTGIEQLSVTGVITTKGPGGAEHVLLGRRGADTRIYGGLWELAPSGGIDPPAPGASSLLWEDLVGQVQAELETETGLGARIHQAKLVCIARDASAGSADLVVCATLAGSIDELPPGRTNWEYSEVLWLPISAAAAFAAREPMIDTSREVMSLLGWR
jgi:hypothetical protein